MLNSASNHFSPKKKFEMFLRVEIFLSLTQNATEKCPNWAIEQSVGFCILSEK